MITIRVPATSANLGPGFDSIGLCLSIYNYLTIERSETTKILWNCDNPGIDSSNNYTTQTIDFLLKQYNKEHLSYTLTFKECNIPVSRGLGSSSAAIVAGIYAANYLLGNILSTIDIINWAIEIEGHPDNVVPAIVGNTCITQYHHDTLNYSSFNFPDDIIDIFIIVPDVAVSTQKARDILPKNYSLDDTVYNISQMGLLVSSLLNKNKVLFQKALCDRIHVPYRKKLIPHYDKLHKDIIDNKFLGMTISGAGSSLIVFSDSNNAKSQQKILKNLIPTEWTVVATKPDINGAAVIKEA